MTGRHCAEQINSLLSKKYAKKADYLLDLDYPMAWLNEEAFGATAARKEADAEADVGEAMKQAGLAGYFTKSQLARGEFPATEIGRRYANSYSPEGGWYVIGIPAPFQVGIPKGTDHESPFSYDTHVPLAFYGLAFQTGNLPDARRTGRSRGNTRFIARHQRARASHGKSADGSAGAAASIYSRFIRTIQWGTSMTPIANPDLSVSFAGIELKNPIIAASGTFGYGIEFEDIVHLDRLGGLVVKGLSKEPMTGNPPPRLYETAAGMLNAIGLQNIGAPAFIAEKLPRLREKKNVVVFANIFGYSRADYEETIEILNQSEGIAAYEINVSCPNTAHGGIQFGSDPLLLDEVVRTAKRVAARPIIVKLSPNVTSIAQMAYVAQEAGADAVSLVNTFLAMAIDAETRRPRIANVTAGLSGPAIKPIALRMVYDAARAVKIPVIGMGGITTPVDVVEFMLAGASAVQVGTASFFDPVASETLVEELTDYCREHRIERLSDLVGGLLTD